MATRLNVTMNTFVYGVKSKSNCGRVVKATDLKSVGVSPRRFEPCQLRFASRVKFFLHCSCLSLFLAFSRLGQKQHLML